MAVPERNTAVFVGDYEILGRLGAGGMAEILLALRDDGAGGHQQVVMKRLLPQHARDPEHARQFMDEARILARLEHPNIVRIHDVAQAKGQNYLVMEYLDGADVRKIRNELGGIVPIAQGVSIAIEAAGGLHFAHEQRDEHGRSLDIVHRDVSAANILVTLAGEVKVIDFGIAKAVVREVETRTGIVKGTQAYMCPEQARAMPVDRRSDVYSLAVVLYELVAGALPLRNGRHHLEALRPIDSPRLRQPDFPRALEEILTRALSPSPELRQQTAAQFRDELVGFMRSAGLETSRKELAALVRMARGEPDPFLTGRETEAVVPLELMPTLAAPSPTPPAPAVVIATPQPKTPQPRTPQPITPKPLAMTPPTPTPAPGTPPPVSVSVVAPVVVLPPAHAETSEGHAPATTAVTRARRRFGVPRWAVPSAVGLVVGALVVFLAVHRSPAVELPSITPPTLAAAPAGALTVEGLSFPRSEPLPHREASALPVDPTPNAFEVPRRVPTVREQIQAERAERERRAAARKKTFVQKGSRSRPLPTSWNVDSPLPPSGGR